MSKACALSGGVSLLATYAFLLVVLSLGAWALRLAVPRFVLGFTVIFWISYACWFAGSYAYIAATAHKLKSFGISWSLNLTAEAGFILALLAGLAVGNFLPGVARLLRAAARPEWFIKTGIVLLGGVLGVRAVEQWKLAEAVMFRGLCAIVEAYLIYWAVVYFVARKYFKFSREWSVPLASGISICGVSAAIATGAAIRAWMGLAVKTDGAAVAAGTMADSLIRAQAQKEQGVRYQEGWVMGTAATVKVFIDVFIGIWSCVLAAIGCTAIDVRPGGGLPWADIWQRFPKFVFGYLFTFLAVLGLALLAPGAPEKVKAAMNEADAFRGIFFCMTFFAIGMVSEFKRLWQEGIGRLAAVYVVCLFGFIIWIGLAISWIFFNGVKPPLVGG